MQDATALRNERQQLVSRIAEIDALIEALETSNGGHAVTEHTVTDLGKERRVWRITLNGKRLPGHEYRDRRVAEDIAMALDAIPEGYSLTYDTDGRLGWKYIAKRGSKKIADADIQKVIRRVNEHHADAPRRQALASERAVEAEMEQIAAAEAERVAAERAHLATPRQVNYILTLLANREFLAFPEPGFVIGGPTERAEIEKLTKEQASAYINSLTGEY